MQATIAVVAGDGVGPEVVEQGLLALAAIGERYGHSFDMQHALIGGAAIDATGSPLPDETLAVCDNADAILLGAVGGPKWSDPTAPVRPEQGLLAIRKRYGLFANLRPVFTSSALAAYSPLRPELLQDVDMLFVRELTGGIYFGKRQEMDKSGAASDELRYTVKEVERVARVAFEAARNRRKRVASVDKANVLASSRLWRKTVVDVSSDYPDVELEHVLVDACTMYLIRQPSRFDVILTTNMFGDILSDEASVLAGSLGMLPSASLSEGTKGLYEPIHGSAPDIAGRGIANPTGTLLSCAMMLRYSFKLEEEAQALEAAVHQTLEAGHRTADISVPGESPLNTQDFGSRILAQLTHQKM
jgi:3-isopropylmalate dehydrogenase